MKYFNTAGPIRENKHYCLSPLDRINKAEVLNLIEQEKYFILHAPRQTGKTSVLFALRDYLNKEDKYYCVYVNVEDAQANRSDYERGNEIIVQKLETELKINHPLLYTLFKQIQKADIPKGGLVGTVISELCLMLDKPLVLLIDEIDALVGDTLISVLRQLRSGYTNRPKGFPQTVVLCGVRDVRDYRLHSDIDKTVITGGSAFNIKAESLKLGNFTLEEIRALYEQHTAATGQKFNEDVYGYVLSLTSGQPWLVNALAYESTFKLEKDVNKPITKELIEQSKENMIMRRDTHIDVLIDKLKEERVRRVIEPILYNEEDTHDFDLNDVMYVVDLGLIKVAGTKQLQISNAIYQEIIPRELSYGTQISIVQEAAWYTENGKLRMDKLLAKFQEFFRENSEVWLERFAYKEAGPHLLLMAFLQRIINGGGKIFREYGLGKRRIDLLVEYEKCKYAIELKVLKGDRSKKEGLLQLADYMDKSGASEGHLVLFDKRKDISWEDKLYNEKVSDKVIIWGM